MFFLFSILIVFLFFFSKLYLSICKKHNVYDLSNSRSSHKGKVITGGGIILFISLLVYLFLYNKFSFYFWIGFFLISLLGFLDDLRIVTNTKKKLLFQIIISFIVCLEFGFETFYIFIPFLLLIFLNVYNFMDGINGMIGIYSLFLIPILVFFNFKLLFFDEMFLYFLVVALGVFGYYNFRKKALLFAGDIGSLSLGLIIGFIFSKFSLTTNSFLCFSLILIFIADFSFTLFYRVLNKENIFEPHRMHIYERLVDCTKLTHIHVALIYSLLQFFLNIYIYINFEVLKDIQWRFYIIIFIILLIIYSFILQYLENFKLNAEKGS